MNKYPDEIINISAVLGAGILLTILMITLAWAVCGICPEQLWRAMIK